MMASTVNLVAQESYKQDSLPAISEILSNNPFQGKCPSPNTLRRHSVAFPLPKIEVVAVKERIMDEHDDSCPSSPLSSSSNSEPSSPTEDPTPSKVASQYNGRRCSVDGNLGSKSLKCQEIIQVPAIKNNRKRRNSYKDLDIGDEPYTSEEEEEVVEKPKRVKASGPRYSKGKGKNKGKLECEGESCLLCKNGSPYYLQKSMNPGWRETVLAVFEYFPKRITESEWKAQQGIPNDKTEEEMAAEIRWLFFPDAYSFLEYHWDSLCPPQHRNRTFVGSNWRKTIQDTLSHNRTFFISGKEIFGKTGFWRLAPKAPSAICASILGDSKAAIDYNINNESGDSSPMIPNNCSFQEILKSPVKEESRDVPLKRDEGYDFSKFDLLVAAIDHIESLQEDY